MRRGMYAVRRIGTNAFYKKMFPTARYTLCLPVFLQLMPMQKQSVYSATAFVSFLSGIVVFDVGNAIVVEQWMCVCFTESFENNFWL